MGRWLFMAASRIDYSLIFKPALRRVLTGIPLGVSRRTVCWFTLLSYFTVLFFMVVFLLGFFQCGDLIAVTVRGAAAPRDRSAMCLIDFSRRSRPQG
jgi:hypothetical protein